jgi:hypothetical protein
MAAASPDAKASGWTPDARQFSDKLHYLQGPSPPDAELYITRSWHYL